MLRALHETFRTGFVHTDVHVVAHQGGWDEILLIVGPMAAIAGLLVIAKRRVDAAAAAPAEPHDDD